MRFPYVVLLSACALMLAFPLLAQSPNGVINGLVGDPSNRVIVGADVVVVNDVTGVQYTTKTNGEGIYVVPSLPPGPYRLQVSKVGFKTLVKPDIVLNVQDALSINFTLPVGAIFETVTVEGGAPLVNTESAAVSTVVNRKFVENMPLNGRSFQDLILLTPGIVTASPQSQGFLGNSGEFSVNGQRTESNNYSVDGVSANVGVQAGFVESPGASGSLPASTALGTTQGLVSVDALEEFRIQSSTYSAEYGRNPGGQFSFVTRSGTNEWHGTAFDYLRNNYVDANDWFNDFFGLPQPSLRQNDFGGTIGGPVEIPHLYNGKSRTFFFFSYEGLRLVQPQPASVNYVPDVALRRAAPAALQPVLNAFPLPTPGAPDLGNGLGEFIGTWSNPSQIDSVSVRLDHVVKQKLRVFLRFSDVASFLDSRFTGNFSPSSKSSNSYKTRTITVGASSLLSSRLSNELRVNYSFNDGINSAMLDGLGGAQPTDLAQLQGVNKQSNPTYQVSSTLAFAPYFPELVQNSLETSQRQWNLVDTLSLSIGRHQFKFGADYRRLSPIGRSLNPRLDYDFDNAGNVQANVVGIGVASASLTAYPVYANFSAFAQDEWRLASRLTVSFGLRWEVNPAPGATHGNLPYTVRGNSLQTLALAPQGTPLWNTSWYNLAPRLGLAYVLRGTPGHETVVRGGGGVFFDTGQQLGSQGYFGPGFSAFNLFGADVGSPVSFPVPLAQYVPAIANPPVPPYTGTQVYAFPAHLQLPYTLQWNASVERAFGKAQALTVSYVGANGRRLLEQNEVNVNPFNPNFGTVIFSQNGLTSSYNALQIQYQRTLTRGLQALASYTWSHSLDYGSQNSTLPYIRGNSDFDVRHGLSAALSYDLPNASNNKFYGALLNHWGLDDRFSARTAFPVNLTGNSYFDPATGRLVPGELNIVSGVPVYRYGRQYPGSREINPDAFSPAPQGEAGDAPRNFMRGFGALQMDLAVRREFLIYDRLKLQFRAEAFNAFNHPNFGLINTAYCPSGPGCTFGQATATLAQSLGVLSPLYQTGGPRSLQFALKFTSLLSGYFWRSSFNLLKTSVITHGRNGNDLN
jgi:hypothetical protein